MIAAIAGWLTSRIAGPIAAAVAALLLVLVIVQNGQIHGWPIVGGGYAARVAELEKSVGDNDKAWSDFAASQAQQILAARDLQRRAQDDAAGAYARGLAASQTVTQTIIRKVPVYVSEKSDTGCIVPWGAVRLFDAAASGSDPGVVSTLVAPGQPDDAASGIPLSGLVALLAQNLGAGRDNAGQLKAVQAASPPPPN